VNFVCEPRSALLIRALEPTAGLEAMRLRRGLDEMRLLCSGPGRLCQALAISHDHDGLPLDRPPFALLPRERVPEIATAPRIGITRAVDRPWRYVEKGSRFLSRGVPRA
jgi:DNA-3-methyladenine glycosylase